MITRRVHGRHWLLFTVSLLATLILVASTTTAEATTHYNPPRARNYGFSDIPTFDASQYASDRLAGIGYNSLAYDCQAAHYAYSFMDQNAVFSFTGHGLADYNYQRGAGLYFYNTYDYPTHPANTYFYNRGGTNSNSSVYINNLGAEDFGDMLLAVNTACGSAWTHDVYGNFTQKMVDKGCSCAIGFWYDVYPVQAVYYDKRFFYLASNGYSFSTASYAAVLDTYTYTGSYGGVDTVMLYGNGALKLTPARYGN